MLADLSRFKVIHGTVVLNAVALMDIAVPHVKPEGEVKIMDKPKFITVLAINEDGNMVQIRDEAWCFQFIPVLTK